MGGTAERPQKCKQDWHQISRQPISPTDVHFVLPEQNRFERLFCMCMQMLCSAAEGGYGLIDTNVNVGVDSGHDAWLCHIDVSGELLPS